MALRKTVKHCFVMSLLSVGLFVGCSHKKGQLNLSDLKTSTLYVEADGKLQMADIEVFDKEYYDQKELKEFINTAVDEYQKEAGEESVSCSDVSVSSDMAKALFHFRSVKDYNNFINNNAQILTVQEASSNIVLPEVFVSAEDGSKVSKEDVLKNDKYQLLIIQEALDIQVEGTIHCYSNAMLLNDTTVQITGEDVSVIVFETV